MSLARAFRHRSVLLLLAAASAVGTVARAFDLTPVSPFSPPASATDSVPQQNTPLELHGIMSLPGGDKFNICDQTGHINTWVGLNEPGKQFVVRTEDVTHNRVTVEYQGRQISLTLPQPKITSMGNAPMMAQQPMPMPMQMPVPTAPQASPPNGFGPEEQRQRLERIAEEIRRRRALRAGMMQMQGGAMPPGFVQPPPVPQAVQH